VHDHAVYPPAFRLTAIDLLKPGPEE
jgi:hypothetical protein